MQNNTERTEYAIVGTTGWADSQDHGLAYMVPMSLYDPPRAKRYLEKKNDLSIEEKRTEDRWWIGVIKQSVALHQGAEIALDHSNKKIVRVDYFCQV